MARKDYEDLLESTKKLGPIDEMGEDDTENKTRGFPEDSKDEEEVDFIPGITAGEDLAMDFREILENWLETMGERHGDDKLQELLNNPDFKDTVIENVTTMMTSLGVGRSKEEPPVESKVDEDAKRKLRCAECGKEQTAVGDIAGKKETIQYCSDCKQQTTHKISGSKEVDEELSPSPADHAEGLVNMDDLRNLKSEIRNIGEDLKEEGFDAVVVKEVIANAADEALLGLDDEDEYDTARRNTEEVPGTGARESKVDEGPKDLDAEEGHVANLTNVGKMQGLVETDDLQVFHNVVNNMTSDLLIEGFEKEDVTEFISSEAEEEINLVDVNKAPRER
jgi:ribosomal protein L44E